MSTSPGKIRIHVLHCGEVCVSPYLPFGGENCSLIKAAGLTTPRSERLWLPVSAYLIEHPKGTILLDTGWHREISPNGVYDKKAQIRHMGHILYLVNQGKIAAGQSISKQLAALGITPDTLDYVLLSHLDCDHASGLREVKTARHILVSDEEVRCAKKHRYRYHASMWQGVNLTPFSFADTGIGPFGKSYDLFDDGSIQMVSIPGHSDGLFAVLIRGTNGQFVLLFADGGYASRSWQEMIRPGISLNPAKQMQSLAWIRDMSRDPACLASFANHDPEVLPQILTL